MAHVTSHIDSPIPGSLHYRQHIPVEGWIFDDTGGIVKIAAYHGPNRIGETTILIRRRDVIDALDLPPTTATGFRFLACLAKSHAPTAVIDVRAQYEDGRERELGAREIRLCPSDHTRAPYGHFCDPTYSAVLHREHIYSSGNPSFEPSSECLALVESYLPPAASVLDVGCGVGAYARPLQQSGFTWTGCELSRECLRQLALERLPHRVIRRRFPPWRGFRLPASDGDFDTAIAIEVLEHTRRPGVLVAEMRRVVSQRVLVSVPNMEILPMLSDQLVAPWHILEKDHHSFFNRASLQALLARHFRHVEVIDYGKIPVQSTDGVPLNYHLFAICDV